MTMQCAVTAVCDDCAVCNDCSVQCLHSGCPSMDRVKYSLRDYPERAIKSQIKCSETVLL